MDSSTAYEVRAQSFLSIRDQSTIGTRTVEAWASQLVPGCSVLEIGCGAGLPITKQLVNAGLDVFAMDSSIHLTDVFKKRFPNVPVKCEKVQESKFFERTFDAALAVGLLFLLCEKDQINLFKNVSNALVPGGQFLFSSPIERAIWQDNMTGLFCSSLGIKQYQSLFSHFGFKLKECIEDSGKNNYFWLIKNEVDSS